MPAHVLSFPFRIEPNGSAALVEQDSDAEIEELLAVAMLTSPGERATVPTFGVADPAFVGFDQSNLQRHCLDFGPDVTILTVGRVVRSDEREELSIAWERRGDER